MGTLESRVGVSALIVIVLASACLPGGGPAIDPIVDEAGSPPPTSLINDAGALDELNLGPAFAVTGLQPSHGPWTGGTRTNISGRGFSSNIQVWIGGSQVAASNLVASDPTSAAIVTPPGKPGPADVRVKNAGTGLEATLPAGFIYDSFAVTPGTGSTTGGTRIALQGSGTRWSAASTVTVGGLPCTGVTFTDETDLSCTTPPNGPGSQSVVVTSPGGLLDQADDGFVYTDSPDGYRGGLYGGALSGTVTVLAFDQWTGVPLEGGLAIAGSNLATAVMGTIDAAGAAQLSAPSLSGTVTVTVAAKCHQPMTYVDVPVDTVTFYLTPALDPSCAGDPPSSGNFVAQDYGQITGELVWSGAVEAERSPWSNVPKPGPNERQAAYVFLASGNPLQTLEMPDPSQATTPSSTGYLGYAYSLSAVPGNQTLYALAGLEQIDDAGQTSHFEPFAMGLVRGVAVQPSMTAANVDIPMTTLLDRSLATLPQPPPLTPGGPDRFLSSLSIGLGAGAYALLPQGESTTFLPVAGNVTFVGVPALDGTLAGSTYDVAGAATTASGTPASVVAGVQTTDANDPLTLGGFFDIPKLVEPSGTTWGGTHVQIQANQTPDLALVNVSTGEGLVAWQIVAPGSDLSFDLPDLSQLQGVETLIHGPIAVTFTIARINGFQYGQVRTGQLGASAWSAYAQDTASGSY